MTGKILNIVPDFHNAQEAYFAMVMGAVLFVIAAFLIKEAFGELDWFQAGDMIFGIMIILLFLLGIAMIVTPAAIFFLL